MNNKVPQINVVFNRRKTASATRKSPVEIRIAYDYKQKYIGTGIMLYANQWKKGKIINCPDIVQISKILDRLLTDIKQVILEMIEEGYIDISSISDRLQRKKGSQISFIEFCKQRMEVRKFGKEKDTKERYDRFMKLFIGWGRVLNFEDIKDNSIILYDQFLTEKGMKPYSKWNNYHRFLNSFINDAIDAGYIKRNPYRWLNIEKDKCSKGLSKCLTPEEFQKLKTASMPTESIEKVRDVFVFQTYTCLSYSDLKEFDCNAIEMVKNMNVYIGCRKKTGITFTIPLLTPALEILHKYNNKLPIISNVKYNEYLKVAAQAAGIDKPISSHWARHTGATLLLNGGISMKIVSKICGHSSTKITEQVYAKLLDETVVDAVKNVKLDLK